MSDRRTMFKRKRDYFHDDRGDRPVRQRVTAPSQESLSLAIVKAKAEIRQEMLQVVIGHFQQLQTFFNDQISNAVLKFQRMIDDVTIDVILPPGLVDGEVESDVEDDQDDIGFHHPNDSVRPGRQSAERGYRQNTKRNRDDLALMKKLNETRFIPSHETVSEFLARFDDLVNNIRRHTELPDKQVKLSLLLAVNDSLPFLECLDKASRDGLTISEIKSRLYKNEEHHEARESGSLQDNSASHSSRLFPKVTSKTPVRPTEEINCYRCGKLGHYKENCTAKGTLCYNCNKITDHYSVNCPEKKSSLSDYHYRKSNSRGGDRQEPKRKIAGSSKAPYKATEASKNTGRLQALIGDVDTESIADDRKSFYDDEDNIDERVKTGNYSGYSRKRAKSGDEKSLSPYRRR